MTAIAVLNAGSSSVKFALHEADSANARLFHGQIESIGAEAKLKVVGADGSILAQKLWAPKSLDHAGATLAIVEIVRSLAPQGSIAGVGHRVVHGGVKYERPTRVTQAVVDDLATLEPLAPLHQPHNLAPIRTLMKAAPSLPQVACFDTAFHRRQPSLAQAFALPRAISAEGVHRYGFHGLSYDYLSSRFAELDPERAPGRVVYAHLGNGASLCAVKAGVSVASTMGFTAVDGLMMGTRCGAIDPGVLLYLMQSKGYDATRIESLIYRESGLLGVSGIASDMRTLRASAEPAAREAIELFVYRIVREIGSMAAALGGLDALVFSGGIGENDAALRTEVVEGCRWLGAAIDEPKNKAGLGRLSPEGGKVAVWAVATDEERLIARRTAEVLGRG
jgi:acetate kinase